MTALDTTLAVIAARPAQSIDDVLAIMRALDQALPDADGLKWFNYLYLEVTESVKKTPPASGWEDAAWLERLDVIFARLYFDAVAAWSRGPKAVARCWRPLLECRERKDVARIQFAFAGMNAHINHDLAVALIRTDEERGVMPERGSKQHRDFERVNVLLEAVEGRVKQVLLTGIIGDVDRTLGRIDDVIALWKVGKARDTAWTNGEILWDLRHVRPVSDKFLGNLDRLVGLASKALLVPTV